MAVSDKSIKCHDLSDLTHDLTNFEYNRTSSSRILGGEAYFYKSSRHPFFGRGWQIRGAERGISDARCML